MRKKIVVHIGTHKTGTSSIQRTLERNRERLQELGVLYPATNREPHPHLPKHTSVFHAIADEASTQAERKLLVDEFEASGCTLMIISEEGLSEPRPKAIDFFRPLTARYEIQAVAYLRRQDIFVESLYNQFVRERRELLPIVAFSRSKNIRNRLDYHGILMSWRQLGTVNALHFDLVKSRLSDTLLETVGVTPLNEADPRENVSPDMRAISALAYIYRTNLNCDVQAVLNVYRQVYEGQPARKTIMGSRLRNELLQWCAASNERLARDFGVSFSEERPVESAYPNDMPELDAAFAALAKLSLRAPVSTPG